MEIQIEFSKRTLTSNVSADCPVPSYKKPEIEDDNKWLETEISTETEQSI